MHKRKDFEVAPMSKTVKIISWVAPVLVLWCTGAVLFALVSISLVLAVATALVTFAILPIAALFAVKGYAIEDNTLLVQRLFWTDRLELSENPKVYRASFKKTARVVGNGGLFSISGWYWNKELGKFRAFMTNPDFMVVIEDGERKIALSPANPEKLIEKIGSGDREKAA